MKNSAIDFPEPITCFIHSTYTTYELARVLRSININVEVSYSTTQPTAYVEPQAHTLPELEIVSIERGNLMMSRLKGSPNSLLMAQAVALRCDTIRAEII